MSGLRYLNWLHQTCCLAGLLFMVHLCIIHYQKDETVTNLRYSKINFILLFAYMLSIQYNLPCAVPDEDLCNFAFYSLVCLRNL
jgi:hypothetical protein